MSRWVISSSLLAALLLAVPAPAGAGAFLSRDEALALAFPGCDVERRTHYLTGEQVERAREASGSEIPGALVHAYAATCEGEAGGTAYLDTHRVRTLPETLMVVVAPDGTVRRIEVLAFREPREYLAREGWYGQFLGRGLDEELNLRRGIRGITGATLTARATTEAVRRVLALHAVLEESTP